MSSSRRGFLREIAAAAAARRGAGRARARRGRRRARPRSRDAEIERYSRQLVLPEWTELAQVALRDASVLVIGAGALGSPVALYLAGAGVGRLGIADFDVVEISNLAPPAPALHARRGRARRPSRPRPSCASSTPRSSSSPTGCAWTPAMRRALVEGQDLVVDCSDSFATRYAVNAACCAAGVDLVEGGVVGWSGLVMAVRPGRTACYRCAFPVEPEHARSCAEAGVVGPAAGVIGSLQALEALKLLTGTAAPLTDAFLTVDLATLETLRVHAGRRPECTDCGG